MGLLVDKIIDFHVHMGKTSSGGNLTAEDLVASMDKFNIQYSGLSILNGIETGPLNDKTMEAIDQYPDRIIGFVYLNPRDPHAIDDLHRCMKHPGMRGVKFHSWKHGYFPSNNGEVIVDILGGHLPMEQVKLDFLDKIVNLLRI